MTCRDVASLPGELTSFVGRRQATADVKRALMNSRLVTLVGPGGVGKSRLALHVARDLRRSYPDGVFLVELAKVQCHLPVASAVAAALVMDRSVRDPEAALVDYLADKRMLVLLDNCEHVLDGCAKLMTTLLSAAPGLTVLATSREPMCVAAENVWPVAPLSVPGTREGALCGSFELDGPSRSYEAVALFEARASAVSPEFSITPENEAAVVRLCQRLDGVPLALELAAVRVRVLSVEQILARLEHRFQLLTTGNRAALPRHQTLRAAVGWSYDLCTEQERVLWARLSVFAGEFELDAAENVCAGDGLTTDAVLAGIAGLVDKSVLTKVEHGLFVRYTMLETIRQYGAERLTEEGDQDELRRRHRDYYLRLAENADAESWGPRQAELVRMLRAERANLCIALEYCVNMPGEARSGLRLASALWFYWIVCGFVRDGRYWLDKLLALETEPTAERARALRTNGWVAFFQGDSDGSIEMTSQARESARRLGDETELAYATEFLGAGYACAGDFARALPLLDEALGMHERSGKWTAPALVAFSSRARAASLLDESTDAAALLLRGEEICASLGESWARSWAEWNLSVIRWRQGRFDEAADRLLEALRIKRDLDDQLGIPFCVDLLAALAGVTGAPHRSAVLFGATEKMWRPIGLPLFGTELLLDWREQAKARSREALGSRAFDAAWREGGALTQPAAIAYALGESTEAATAAAVEAAMSPQAVLTKRERQVAELVAGGMSNREIAAELVISQRTAESHIEHIMSKLGFNSRTQIAVWFADYQEA